MILIIIGGTVQAVLTDINLNSDDPTDSKEYVQREQNIQTAKYITYGVGGLAVLGLFVWFIYRHTVRKKTVKNMKSGKKK